MFTTRATLRSTRALRANNLPVRVRRNVRFASDSAGSSSSSSPGTSHIAISAASGAAASTLLFYAWYQFSGMGKIAQTASQTKSYFDSATGQLKMQFKENTPDTNEVIQTLKEQANKYAKFLPGGKAYVDKIFQDIETVQKKHGSEVDSIVREAYGELRDTSKKGLNLETATQSWEVLSKHMQRLGGLAADASQEILDNHPQLRDRFGGSFQQLKQLGDQLGPDAKKQVDDTWKQVQQIVSQGLSFDSYDKVQKLIQEKTEQVKKLGGQVFEKGYKELAPMLENNPQLKQLVEQNKDVLQGSGNVSDTLSKIKWAASSGNTMDLEKYIISAKESAQSQFSSGGLSDWLQSAIPQGGKILPQLQKLKQVAETHGQEAQQLAHDAMNDIVQVLEKRGKQAGEIAQKASQQSK